MRLALALTLTACAHVPTPEPAADPAPAAAPAPIGAARTSHDAPFLHLVGQRSAEPPHAFILAAARRLFPNLPDPAHIPSPSVLRDLAAQRDAITDAAPLPGDLLLFRVPGRGDPPILAVVSSVRADDGTVEFVYLVGGVVRRGWMNRTAPTRPRDDRRRVLNVFLVPELRALSAELHEVTIRATAL